jgi:hypothetical protein
VIYFALRGLMVFPKHVQEDLSTLQPVVMPNPAVFLAR